MNPSDGVGSEFVSGAKKKEITLSYLLVPIAGVGFEPTTSGL